MRTFLSCIGVSIASVVATVVGFILYATVHDYAHATTQRVAFSDFLLELDSGRITSVAVDGRAYSFKTRETDGRTHERETIGPPATAQEVKALRPSDPALPAPTIDVR